MGTIDNGAEGDTMNKKEQLIEIAKESVRLALIDLSYKKVSANNFNELMSENLKSVPARIEKMLDKKTDEQICRDFDKLKKMFSSYEISRKAHSETYKKIH